MILFNTQCPSITASVIWEKTFLWYDEHFGDEKKGPNDAFLNCEREEAKWVRDDMVTERTFRYLICY